jgi:trans-2-enoyl-CoA reductase
MNQIVITTSYGYVNRDRSHEIWASDAKTLAHVVLEGKSEWNGEAMRETLVAADRVALKEVVTGALSYLPDHIRTRDAVYVRVIRETVVPRHLEGGSR